MSDFWIYVFLIAMLAVLGVFIAIAANRKHKGFKIMILRDFRNPNKRNTKYWAMFDSRKDKYIKLYSNIFRPMKNKVQPPADMSGYSFDRTLYGFQGVSGHPDDDAIVFIHLPLVGRASANEYSINLSEAIQKTMDFAAQFSQIRFNDASGNPTTPIKIGDVISLDNNQYTIANINFNGIQLEYYKDVQSRNRQGETVTVKEKVTTMINDLPTIRRFVLMAEPKDAITPGYAQFFNTDWIMQNMGVIPVEDVNVMLSTQKDYISSFNSQLHARAESKMGIFARYPWLLPMAIMTFVVTISSIMMWYGVSQDTGSVASTATSAIQHILGLTSASNSTLPAA